MTITESLNQAIPEASHTCLCTFCDNFPVSLPVMQGCKFVLLYCQGNVGKSHYQLSALYVEC
jgi:hypothetical protein